MQAQSLIQTANDVGRRVFALLQRLSPPQGSAEALHSSLFTQGQAPTFLGSAFRRSVTARSLLRHLKSGGANATADGHGNWKCSVDGVGRGRYSPTKKRRRKVSGSRCFRQKNEECTHVNSTK